MPITGNLLINGQWQPGESGSIFAVNPANGETLPTTFTKATVDQVTLTTRAAGAAFDTFRNTSSTDRAAFLRTCAGEIINLGDELLDTVQAETGYPRMRCESERARIVGQLNLFADYIETGDYLEARIDTALPDRQPLPRPDIRCLNQAIGVAAVYAVSNFPLAFSTAGGDTASALAAGCPVIVKGHTSHPGTGELVAQALAKAVQAHNLPAGVFGFLQGDREAGRTLVQAPAVKAVGFTGSLTGGMSLSKMAAERPDPIPVFAEMGSVNPVVLLPDMLSSSAEAVAKGFVGSLTMGTGQFCVNPGLVIAMEGEGLNQFIDAARAALSEVPAGVMLNAGICEGFRSGVQAFSAQNGVTQIANGKAIDQETGYYAQANFFKISASDFLANLELQEEVFGPASLLIACEDVEQVKAVVNSLQGQLTGTIHGTENELADHPDLLEIFSVKVGRIVVNGFPTGVEVCHAMVHGGPFPASTDSRFTSVGTAAIKRFVRPVCYQNVPHTLLPDALKNDNPLKLTRMINGVKTADAV